MGGFTAFSASAQTGAQIAHLISGGAFQHNKWCRMRSPVTLQPGTRQLSPLQLATWLSWSETLPQSATGQGGAFARPLAAGQLSAWRINLNKPRVFSMYKFSSLPRAISAATAIASWASSSSDDGGAAASRGRGASIAVHASAAGPSLHRVRRSRITGGPTVDAGACASPERVGSFAALL